MSRFNYKKNIVIATIAIIAIATILLSSPLVNFGYNYVDAQKKPTTRDTDGDGKFDNIDNCPRISNPTQADSDGDGKGDACDDSDHDRFVDALDNCPNIPNRDQKDSDGDGTGDVCDSTPTPTEVCDGIDNNGDGIVDENCPEICGDGKDNNGNGVVDENCTPPPEVCDGIDNNGDGIVDENCPEICGDGKDNNGNGIVDENCQTGYTATLIVKKIVFGPDLPNEFTITVRTNNLMDPAIPDSAPGSASGFPYLVKPGNIYISERFPDDAQAQYAYDFSCMSDEIQAGETKECIVTNTAIQ